MSNFVLDFIKGTVQNVVNPIAKVGNEAAAGVDELTAFGQALAGNKQAAQKSDQAATNRKEAGGGFLHQGGVIQSNTGAPLSLNDVGKIIGVGAEIGSNVIGGGAAADVAESAVKNGASKLTMDFIHGAQGGAAAGALGTAGGQLAAGQNLNIEGIAKGGLEGAAVGGAFGAAVPAVTGAVKNAQPLNEAGGINNTTTNLFNQEDINTLAKTDDHKAIQSTLEDKVGPVLAQKVAPAIAKTDDPHVVSNIIENELNTKLTAPTPEPTDTNALSPTPAPLSPPTPVSDINTPQQVAEQGDAAVAAYTPEQASLNATEQQVPKSFMNAPGEASEIPHVSNLAAVTDMHDILNAGGSTDEALNHYMMKTNSSPSEAQTALNKLIQDSGTDGSLDRSKINANLNPQTDKVNFPESTSKDAAVLNSKYANNQVVAAGRPVIEAMQNLDEHDLELTRSLKGRDPELVINQAHDPEQFAQAVTALKNYNDYTQAAGAKLGQDIPYRQNYGLRTPYAPPEDIQAATSSAGLPDNASYTKGRQYQTHEEALANGETPKHGSALEDIQADIQNRSHDQAQLALAQGLEKTYPGQVKIINNGQIPNGYHQLLIPNGDKIFMPQDIASDINSRQMAQYSSGKLGTAAKAYDTINSTGKNLELGGGLFHGSNTGGIFIGQQIASGKLFSNPSAAGSVIKNTFSDTATKDYMDNIGREGTFDENHSVINAADAAGLQYTNTQADIKSAGKLENIPILKQIHSAIFERQIPTMMLETFRQKTQGLDIFGNSEDREQAISIAKQVNKEFGSINRDIQGLTPEQFKIVSRFVLAASYQEGQITTLIDALSKKGPEGTLARQAVFGKALLFGGLAALGSAAGGEFNGQTPKQVALDIMNKALNPSFNIDGYKVGLPATQISNVAKPIEQTVAGIQAGKGALVGVQDFANSHLAFAPAKAEELGTNKDFSGNPIHGTDYFGRPIPVSHTLETLASGVLPIPIGQAAQTATGGQSTAAAIANTIGLNVHPQYSLNYAPIAGQTYVQRLEATPGISKDQINADTQFFNLLGQGVKGKAKVIQEAEKAIIAKNPDQANKIINDYNQKLMKALLPWEQSGGTKYIDTTMLQLLKTATITYQKANKNVAYDTKTNPTAYGVPISALATQPQAVR